MDDAAERYLDELRRNLRPLPEDERSDAVREIESHIAEGQADGRPTAAVLAGLGDAKTLARAYVADYHLRVPRDGPLGSVAHFVLSSAFVSGTGVLSLFVVPMLALLTFLAGLLAVVTPVLGVLRTFGVPGIVMGDSGGWQVPTLWSFPASLVFAAAFAVLAWAGYKLLRGYLRLVLAGYRKLLPFRSVPRWGAQRDR
jgi:uncharacterized membrane protein